LIGTGDATHDQPFHPSARRHRRSPAWWTRPRSARPSRARFLLTLLAVAAALALAVLLIVAVAR